MQDLMTESLGEPSPCGAHSTCEPLPNQRLTCGCQHGYVPAKVVMMHDHLDDIDAGYDDFDDDYDGYNDFNDFHYGFDDFDDFDDGYDDFDDFDDGYDDFDDGYDDDD